MQQFMVNLKDVISLVQDTKKYFNLKCQSGRLFFTLHDQFNHHLCYIVLQTSL